MKRRAFSHYLYAAENPIRLVDPSGLKEATCGDYCTGGQIKYDDETHCCVQEGAGFTVVEKQEIYVINRGGGERTGLGGHLDLGLPGLGLIGYYGFPGGSSGRGSSGTQDSGSSGMGLQGILNVGRPDYAGQWVPGSTSDPVYESGRVPRPNRIVGEGGSVFNPVLGEEEVLEGELSTICVVRVCPTDSSRIVDRAKEFKSSPGTFNIVSNNCAACACDILSAGGLKAGGPLIKTPQGVIDDLVQKYGAKCFTGYTKVDLAGNFSVVYKGPAPKAPSYPTMRYTKDPRIPR